MNTIIMRTTAITKPNQLKWIIEEDNYEFCVEIWDIIKSYLFIQMKCKSKSCVNTTDLLYYPSLAYSLKLKVKNGLYDKPTFQYSCEKCFNHIIDKSTMSDTVIFHSLDKATQESVPNGMWMWQSYVDGRKSVNIKKRVNKLKNKQLINMYRVLCYKNLCKEVKETYDYLKSRNKK